EADAQRLADELGHLPLALEQAGALQAEAGMSVDEYLQQLAKHMSDTLQMPKPTDYPRSMTAAWKLSVSQLEQQMSEAVELLRSWAIRVIGRYALAKIDPETRTLQVHRLIQALLRADLAEEEHERYRKVVHLLLASSMPGDPDDETKWLRYGELVQHIVPADVASSRDPQVRDFALNMVRYLYMSGQHQTSRTFVESFLDQWTKDSGPDDPHVIAAQALLGSVLRQLGEYPR